MGTLDVLPKFIIAHIRFATVLARESFICVNSFLVAHDVLSELERLVTIRTFKISHVSVASEVTPQGGHAAINFE